MTGEQKTIAILGSTGSIGRQALEVVAAYPERFAVQVLAAGNQADLLIEQALAFRPQQVVIGNEAKYEQVKAALQPQGISVATGAAALEAAVQLDMLDLVLVALVGYAGLKPTVSAIRAGKDIALANKETLVVAGELVTQLVAEHGVQLLPVDSEHSAIFQCLAGEQNNPLEKIILTASGGPFRGKKAGELATVTREQALRHPNWEMGAKITIDSATLMNKGLEVIEAHWLFGMQRQQIEVVVHPQSIIHSLVQFEDGSIKAQMGLPDMKLPIQYALTYPERLKTTFPRFNFAAYPALTFEPPDLDTFRNLALAYESMDKGGNMPCVLNAANEVAVEAFLQDKIGFLDMPELIATCLAKIPHIKQPDLNDYVETDKETRIKAQELIK